MNRKSRRYVSLGSLKHFLLSQAGVVSQFKMGTYILSLHIERIGCEHVYATATTKDRKEEGGYVQQDME